MEWLTWGIVCMEIWKTSKYFNGQKIDKNFSELSAWPIQKELVVMMIGIADSVLQGSYLTDERLRVTK